MKSNDMSYFDAKINSLKGNIEELQGIIDSFKDVDSLRYLEAKKMLLLARTELQCTYENRKEFKRLTRYKQMVKVEPKEKISAFRMELSNAGRNYSHFMSTRNYANAIKLLKAASEACDAMIVHVEELKAADDVCKAS